MIENLYTDLKQFLIEEGYEITEENEDYCNEIIVKKEGNVFEINIMEV